MASDRSPENHTAPSPLGATLGFSFFNSLGTGVVTNGLFFLTRHAYGFDQQRNYLAAIVFGAVYVAAAFGVGPALARAMRQSAHITPRATLTASMIVLAAVCWLPLAARLLGAGGSTWVVWVLIVVYATTTGVIWPITESYVSGARSGADLRSAVGRFNISWAVALVAAFWLMGPFVERYAVETIATLGLVHLGALVLLPIMGAHPGRHVDEVHDPHPPIYRDLLATFRLLLPGSYVMLSALSPFLPEAFSKAGLVTAWQTPAAASWMVSRLLVFIVLERWHGWRGRWSTAVFGIAALIVGFVITVLGPRLGLSATQATTLLIGGLTLFGVGLGVIYFAALYYALEVGQADVAAGGTHEALIGIGYTLGPGCMLAASVAVSTTRMGPGAFEPVVFGLMGLVALVIAAGVVWNIRRAHRGHEPSDGSQRT